MNAITSGRRSRTRDAIGAVRHVFVDADDDGVAVLSRVESRRDLPPPSYVLHTSRNHVHVFWRVTGFDRDLVERLQKQLARELGTDPAATPVTQNTRLPGFFSHKRPQPHLVTIEYRDVDVRYRPEDFPPVKAATTVPRWIERAEPRDFDVPVIDRARRYLVSVPPAISGQHGDVPTFRAVLSPHARVRARSRTGAVRARRLESPVPAAVVRGGAARHAPPCYSLRARTRRRIALRFEMTRYGVRYALIDGRDRMLLQMYDMVDVTLARFSRFIPEPLYQRLERAISRRQMELLQLPPHLVAEGSDGFQPMNVIDIVFAHCAPNPNRLGCCSESELIEFANRRRPVDDPGFHHIMNCSPCYRRLRTLQRLKVH